MSKYKNKHFIYFIKLVAERVSIFNYSVLSVQEPLLGKIAMLLKYDTDTVKLHK